MFVLFDSNVWISDLRLQSGTAVAILECVGLQSDFHPAFSRAGNSWFPLLECRHRLLAHAVGLASTRMPRTMSPWVWVVLPCSTLRRFRTVVPAAMT